MLTKQDKKDIIEAFKSIDVRRFEIDHTDSRLVKWFRFGNYNAMKIAAEIVKQMPERKKRTNGSKQTNEV